MAHVDPDSLYAVGGPGGAVHVDEAGVLLACSEGQVVNTHLFLLCLLTFWLVVPVLYTLWRVIVTGRHSYVLTDQRLREYTGVLFRNVEELELYRVKDISVEQPLLHALLGRGRVILRTSDLSTPTVVLNAVPEPRHVADLVRNCVERCRVAKGVREIDG